MRHLVARMKRSVGLLLVLMLLFGQHAHARAADAAAESLFQEAVTLMQSGRFAEACPLLEESQRREPRSGTLLNLGACQEQQGKTASAWASYKDAAALARSENRPRNVHKANQLAAAVEPRLVRVRFRLLAQAEGETVLLDDVPLAAATLSTALPVDPGEHAVSARANGFVDWSTRVRIDESETIEVPALLAREEKATNEPEAVATSALPAVVPADTQTPVARVPRWAWVAGGAGVALVATSVVFRLGQTAAGDKLDERCGDRRTSCEPGYDFASDRSREKRDFALFVSLGATGLLALAAATYGVVDTQLERRRAEPRARSFSPVLAFSSSSAYAGLRGGF